MKRLALAIAVTVFLLGGVLRAQTAPSIVGTWRVVRYEEHRIDGTVTKRFGDKPLGYFIYDATGHVAIQVMENPATHNPPTSFAYFGTYRVDAAKGVVIHHVEGAIEGLGGAGPKVREYIGKDEMRPFQLEGDRLTISTRRDNALGLTVGEGVEYTLRELVRVK